MTQAVTNKLKSGFTLVELLVVMFILSLMFVLLVPNFIGARQRAEDARTKANLQTLRTALRTYYNDKGIYPSALDSDFYNNYLPGVEIGVTYNRNGIDDSKFTISAKLSTGDPVDLGASQKNCGVGITEAMVFMLCGN